jgi:hypothetical protein
VPEDTKYELAYTKVSASPQPRLPLSRPPCHDVDQCSPPFPTPLAQASAKLLKYFNGANDAEERLERTTPTLAALLLSKDSRASERNYSFSMWLPTTYQNEARDEVPQPNDEEVQIMDYPETTVYVRTFGGFATEATALQEITTLHEELTKDEQEFEEDVVFVAVYDSAVKLLNRHNEVHVMKKGEAPSTAQVS